MSGGYHPWSKVNAHRWSNLNARRHVGEQQALACRGCANYGAAVSAIPGSIGNVYRNQCFDPACNATKVAERIKAEKAEQKAAARAERETTRIVAYIVASHMSGSRGVNRGGRGMSKYRVKVGNLYFSRWLGDYALMIVDDSPGAKYAARLFTNINQALSVSREIGGIIEHLDKEEEPTC